MIPVILIWVALIFVGAVKSKPVELVVLALGTLSILFEVLETHILR